MPVLCAFSTFVPFASLPAVFLFLSSPHHANDNHDKPNDSGDCRPRARNDFWKTRPVSWCWYDSLPWETATEQSPPQQTSHRGKSLSKSCNPFPIIRRKTLTTVFWYCSKYNADNHYYIWIAPKSCFLCFDPFFIVCCEKKRKYRRKKRRNNNVKMKTLIVTP